MRLTQIAKTQISPKAIPKKTRNQRATKTATEQGEVDDALLDLVGEAEKEGPLSLQDILEYSQDYRSTKLTLANARTIALKHSVRSLDEISVESWVRS